MKKEKIHILGVGNNTAVYIDLVEACGYEVSGLYHYEPSRIGQLYFGHRICGTHHDIVSSITDESTLFAISIGDNKIRQEIAQQIRSRRGRLPTLIHPSATVSPYANLEESVVVHAGAVVQAGVTIAMDTVISFRAGITHTTTIHRGCYVAGGATVGAYITIEDLAFIGLGATLVSGKVARIGKCAIVGAGSTVLENVDDHEIVAGMPARPINRKIK